MNVYPFFLRDLSEEDAEQHRARDSALTALTERFMASGRFVVEAGDPAGELLGYVGCEITYADYGSIMVKPSEDR